MQIKHANLLMVGAVTLLAGCPTTPLKIPTLSASAGRPSIETDGKILLNGGNFAANQNYYVGVYTTGEPRKIGALTTDTTGSINNTELQYSCGTPGPNAQRAAIYATNGSNLGAAIVSAAISGSTCMP